MKNIISIILISGLLISFSFTEKTTFHKNTNELIKKLDKKNGPASQLGIDRTGGPLAGGLNCGQCHSGAINNAAISIRVKDNLGNITTQYLPGSSYTIELEVTSSFGFARGAQGVLLSAGNVQAGTLSNPGTNTQISTMGGRQYMEHSSPALSAGSFIFTSDWVAPAIGTGNVTIYAAGIVGNGNNATSGDDPTLPVFLQLTEFSSTSITYSASNYCENDIDPTPIIAGATSGIFSSTGGLSLNSSTGTIDLSASTPGTYIVSFKYTAVDTVTDTVTIIAADDASFSYNSSVYFTNGVNPTPTITGITGGTFAGTPSGLSIDANTGVINLSASTPGNYSVYYLTPFGACQNSSNVSVNIKTVTTKIVQNTNNSGIGSLRDVISASVAGDTIRFNPNLIASGSDTVLLTSEIAFTKNLTIIGLYNATDTLFISGNNTNRIFNVDLYSSTVKTLELDSMVLINGNGAINLLGSKGFTVSNCLIKNNLGGYGVFSSTIYSIELNFKNSTISNNNGPGIFCFFHLDSLPIDLFYKLNVVNCQINNNNGNGVFIQVRNFNFPLTNQEINIINSTVANNGGHGIEYDHLQISLLLDYSTFINVHNSTIANNLGFGIKSRFDNNYAPPDYYYEVDIKNSTVVNNAVGSIFMFLTGGLYQEELKVKSSIIALNGPLEFLGSNGAFNSGGNNVFSNTLIGGSVATDQLGVTSAQLNLGPLQNNGGTTQTILPGAGSIAINNGNPSDLIDAQNGPLIGIRDVGAAESSAACYTYNLDTITGCDSAIYNGITYYASQTFTDTLFGQSANGCDSVNTTEVIINTKSFYTLIVSSCSSYTFNGVTYTASNNSATDTLTNSVGCDSIVTLNLTINNVGTKIVQNTNNSGLGSLRQTIADACPGDTIRFNPTLIASGSDSIVLTSEIAFSKNLTIIGLYNASDTLFVSGNNTNRIFNVDLASSLSKDILLDSIVLVNGNSLDNGGAISMINGYILKINNSIIRNNRANANGGGIYSFSSATTSSLVIIFNSVISGNSASNSGGGIFSSSTTAPSYGSSVQLINSLVSNNTSMDGGGIYSFSVNFAFVIMTNSSVSRNSASNAGGGICSKTINNSQSNHSSTSLTNSTVSGNTSKFGGGIYVNSVSGTAIYPTTSYLNIINSTISGNSVIYNGGGIYTQSENSSIVITTSTISRNSASNSGGGMYIRSPEISATIAKSTISRNSVSNAGGGIFTQNYITSFNISVASSILALNERSNIYSVTSSFPITSRPIISLGYNIFGDSIVTGSIATDKLGIDSAQLNLGPLQFNGGVTKTLMPGLGSVAINMGESSDLTNAQNGPVLLGRRDVGAAESSAGCYTYNLDTISGCDSVIYSGTTYYVTQSLSDTLFGQSANGCDSVNITNVNIDAIKTGIHTVSACGSYTFNGITYSSNNNTATDTIVNAAGCDSIITLDLTFTKTKIVQNTNDAGPGSLRQTVFEACPGDTILFNPNLISSGNATILLLSEISITKNLTIIGLYNSTDTLFISGNSANRIFNINLSSSLNKSIYFDKVVLINGVASGDGGGLIATNIANLEVNSSIIKNCSATSGGGIFISSTNNTLIKLTNSKICNNNGEGIFFKKTYGPSSIEFFVENSIISNNIGDGIKSHSSYFNYSSQILLKIKLTLINSSLDNNHGGIALWGTSVSLEDSYCEIELNIDNSTISNNNQGAAIDLRSFGDSPGKRGSAENEINIRNSTIANNDGPALSNYAYALTGGGIRPSIESSNINLINSTIVNNDPTSSSPSGGGIQNIMDDIDFKIQNTILAFNGIKSIHSSSGKPINSFGDNIFSDAAVAGSISQDSLGVTNSQLKLGVLKFNGGTTKTIAPKCGSMAINNGFISDLSDAQNIPISGIRDIGAAEYVEIRDTILTLSNCDSVQYLGNTYFNSTTLSTVLTTPLGCDSTVYTQINVNKSVMITASPLSANDSAQVNGVWYYSSQILKDTFSTTSGCDSIVTLNLTINNSTSSTDNIIACDSYTWIDGITYTSNNSTATKTYTNSLGIDSIVTLNLTINYSTSSTDTQSHCDSYTWIDGNTYTSSNTNATYTLPNAVGCDSIITLNLTILDNTFSTDVQNHCGSYTWRNGVTYTASNTSAKDTVMNAAGCDSIISLNLVIRNKSFATEIISACDSFTWRNGMTYTASNSTATDTIFNSMGCDSVITLNLTINNSSNSTDVVVACNSYTWIDGNTYTSNNNSATHTTTNSSGCDSVVTLDLTINTTGTDTVFNTNSNGIGSLRQVIEDACPGDTIRFDESLIATGSDSIVLTSEIAFNKNLTIIGLYNASDSLFISGNNTNRIFNVDLDLSVNKSLILDSLLLRNGYNNSEGGAIYIIDGESLTMKNSMITNCNSDWAGAISSYSSYTNTLLIENSIISDNSGDNGAGAIYFESDDTSFITINNSTISNNSAVGGNGGGINSGSDYSYIEVNYSTIANNIAENGGGIYSNTNELTSIKINNSTISENHITSRTGGGIRARSSEKSEVFINNSTIFGNSSKTEGGGIYSYANTNSSSVTVINSTITNNLSIDDYAGGIYCYSRKSTSTITLQSSIVALNGDENIDNKTSPTINSLGNNILNDSVMSGSIASDSLGIDSAKLNLGPLQNNGGMTKTVLPIYPSVAIDNGNPMDSSDAQNVAIIGTREVGAAESCVTNYATTIIDTCDSYAWSIDGSTYTTDTAIQHIDTLVGGCLSFYNLDLTIRNTTYATDVQSHCNSYTWTDGITYTSSNNSAIDTIPNSVGCDSIITLNLTINNSTSSTDVVVACDSYTWINGMTYTTSNNSATHTIPNSKGCDSIITLNLTIRVKTYSTDIQNHCDSYTWINGVTYTASNTTAKDTTTNAAGCDSIISLNLVIRNKTFATETITACDSFTWINGKTYTANNNSATDTTFNSMGCDSIITLYLTINQSTSSTDSITACDSYVWLDGITYTADNNSATKTYTNSKGCDSIVTLDLTINNATASIDTQSHCYSYTWINGMTYTSSNNFATHTLTNSKGCDSIVTLNLTILDKTYSTDVQNHCDSFTWRNGVTYTASNTSAKDTTTNAAGCDSIISLNLTIRNKTFATETITACDSFTWINGMTYTASNTTATYSTFNSMGCDSIITLNLTINQSTSSIDTITACDSYVWLDGITYAADNNSATKTYTNSKGCDSIVTLDLTINNATASIDTQSHCDSYTWIDGMTYTASTNSVTHTLTNGKGCDSIVTLNLTILDKTYSTDVQNHCDSFTWRNGVTYTASNTTAKDTTTNAAGCDSIISLNLTIRNKTFATETITACDSFTWSNGMTYTANNNSATDTIFNSMGCDSVITLNLTINNSTSSIDTITACDSYVWLDGITYTSSTNTPTKTLTGSKGCDSVVTLDLTINNATASIDTQSHCDSYTWIDGMTYTASNNSATHTLTNGKGCDSIVTLNLTILDKTYSTDVQNHCDSFTWRNGVTYTASNTTAKDTTTNAAGCDSIISLNLVIRNKTFATESFTVCDSYTWRDGMTYTASNNTATVTLFNSQGCDSIITLDLTILNSTNYTDVQTHCDTYTWIDGNTYTSSTNSATHTLTNPAGCDSVITLDLTINNSTSSTDVQTHCVTYTWINGTTYTSSNSSATHTLTNSKGCDSIVTLNLTINNATSSTDVQTACDSFTWIDGMTYTSSTNSVTHTLTNSKGCDSIVTLNLTINNSNTGIATVTACDSYMWIDGMTYTASNNTATQTLTNADGCDSIVTLDLTINYSSSSTDIQTACDSFTWIDGMTYTTSNNSASHTLTNAAGCDSIVTLNLTIKNSSSSIDVQTHCNSFTWIDGITYTSSNNSATHTLTNAKGCDSIITLNLTINNSNTGLATVTACDTYTWIDGNTYTISNNTATHTLTNSKGCDSIITLNLTINYSNTGIDVVTACDSYTWINGSTYTTSITGVTHTLTNAVGCDSIITLNLTINNSTIGIDVQSHCGTYTWIDGNTYTSSTSSPTWTLIGANSKGCDSIVTLNLTINPTSTTNRTIYNCFSYIVPETGNVYTTSGVYRDSVLISSGCYDYIVTTLTINTVSAGTISQTGGVLTVSVTGDNYRWLDCDNGFAPMPGETSQSFTPTQNGNYACMVYSNQGCKDTTSCFNMNSVGITTKTKLVEWNLFPNPASDKVTLTFSSEYETGSVKIFNPFGKLVYEERIKEAQTNLTVDVSQFANGMYTVVVVSGTKSANKKIVISR